MPTNSTHHLSEFELHGLQAAFTEPDEDIQQETEEVCTDNTIAVILASEVTTCISISLIMAGSQQPEN